MQLIYLVSVVGFEIVEKQDKGKGIAAVYHRTLDNRWRADMEAFYSAYLLQGLQAGPESLFLFVRSVGFKPEQNVVCDHKSSVCRKCSRLGAIRGEKHDIDFFLVAIIIVLLA